MSEPHFTEEGIIELKKMAHEGATNASAALSKLIRQEMKVDAVGVKSLPLEKILEFVGAPEERVTTIILTLSGDVAGQMMLIFPQQAANNVADYLSKRPLGSTHELDELDKSALKECGNIIAGAFLASISDYLQINMLESIPDLATDMLKATVDTIVATFLDNQPAEAITIEINFGMSSPNESTASSIVPGIVTKGYFILLLDIQSAKRVMGSLKTISGGKKMTK